MNYDVFKENLINELNKYGIEINNRTVAVIFKVLCNLNITD